MTDSSILNYSIARVVSYSKNRAHKKPIPFSQRITCILSTTLKEKSIPSIVTFFMEVDITQLRMVELSLNFDKPSGTVSMTETAAKRINELKDAEGREGQAIQIKVVPGGCAGFSYEFDWAPDDRDGVIIEKNGAKLLIEDSDMRMLAGSTLDYTISLKGSKFEINNPNASSSCGCGKSFA